MHRFDKDEDGTVDVVEFTKTFFKMGFDERDKRARARRGAEAVSSGQRKGRGDGVRYFVTLGRHTINPRFVSKERLLTTV